MTKFIMLVGLPGSGKSYYSKEFITNNPAYKYFSSDAYRKEHGLKQTDITFFDKLNNDIRKELNKGINVLYDATNLSSKHRKVLLRMLKKNIEKTCLVMATNLDICIANNKAFNRDHIVPDADILKYYRAFQFPQYFEGWDDIKIIKPSKLGMHKYYRLSDVLNCYATYDQNSKWHKHTLGVHMGITGDRLKSLYNDSDLTLAGYLHDIGKPYVKSIDEETGESHFYGHENVSAYESMFCQGDYDRVRVAQIIALHMKAHDKNWRDKYSKYVNTPRYEILNDVFRLLEADDYACGTYYDKTIYII